MDFPKDVSIIIIRHLNAANRQRYFQERKQQLQSMQHRHAIIYGGGVMIEISPRLRIFLKRNACHWTFESRTEVGDMFHHYLWSDLFPEVHWHTKSHAVSYHISDAAPTN